MASVQLDRLGEGKKWNDLQATDTMWLWSFFLWLIQNNVHEFCDALDNGRLDLVSKIGTTGTACLLTSWLFSYCKNQVWKNNHPTRNMRRSNKTLLKSSSVSTFSIRNQICLWLQSVDFRQIVSGFFFFAVQYLATYKKSAHVGFHFNISDKVISRTSRCSHSFSEPISVAF